MSEAQFLQDVSMRVAVFRLLWDVKERLGMPVSPTLVKTMVVLFRYFSNPSRPDLPLFPLVVTAMFIGDENATSPGDLTEAFLEAVSSFDQQSLEAWGLVTVEGASVWDTKSLQAEVIASQGDVRGAIDWNCDGHDPFNFLSEWLKILLEQLRAKSGNELVDDVNSGALRVACLHFVQGNFLQNAPEQMAATALQIVWEDLGLNHVSWQSMVGCNIEPDENLKQALRQFMTNWFSGS